MAEIDDTADEPTVPGIPDQITEPKLEAPPVPKSLAETGLEETMLSDLALKHIFFSGGAEAIKIAEMMRLDFVIIRDILNNLKTQELIMAQGGSWSLGGEGIRHLVTERGRTKIDEILQRDNYRGPAPVPYSQFVEQLKKQSIRSHKITPERVKAAFGKLVLEPVVVERIGPAINSGKSIFLYGPPGNGKTSLAECIIESISGNVFIPHAIVVDAEIVKVYDELYHKPQTTTAEYDKRWVHTKRPIVIAGGELNLEMLDLQWKGQSTYYEAPFQVKASSGVLFIDDFGRQRCNPQELLNRWIVPLENGFDFLTFRTGQKVKALFDTLVVFSTNLDPKDLVDEAFLRRIRYKIEVGNPSEANYKKIFAIICKKYGIAYDEKMVDYLIDKHYTKAKRPLRACQPRDLLEQLTDINKYTGEQTKLTPETLDRICNLYFVEL